MDWYSTDSESATTPSKPAQPPQPTSPHPLDRPRGVTTVLTYISLGSIVVASIFGLVISGLVFSPLTVPVDGQCLAQSCVLFGSILGLLYVALHGAAARQNHAVARAQPFQHRLHSWAVIAVRMDVVVWMVALCAVAVDVGRTPVRVVFLDLDLFVASLGVVSIICALVIVERAAQPFHIPGISTGWPAGRFPCRISNLQITAADSVSRQTSILTGDNRRVPAGPRPLTPLRPRTMAGDAEASAGHRRELSRNPVPEPERVLRTPRKISSGQTLRPSMTEVRSSFADEDTVVGPTPHRPAPALQRPGTGRSWQTDWLAFQADAGLHPPTATQCEEVIPRHDPHNRLPDMMQTGVPAVLVPGWGGTYDMGHSAQQVGAQDAFRNSLKSHVSPPRPLKIPSRYMAYAAAQDGGSGSVGRHATVEDDAASLRSTHRVPGAFGRD